jgi:CheY-like chemotaxis protein
VDTPKRFVRTLAVERQPPDGFEATADLRPETADRVAGVALVVDDEPLVRTLVSTLLRDRGWSVIEAADGPSALALAPETLGLLVTDYDMPAITGVALAEQLRLRNDRLPVLMVSGHSEIAGELSSLPGPRAAFVSKPFPVEEFISTVRLITA